jgi:hypothetical protein
VTTLGARVKPEFGPTLPELLESRALRVPRWFRGALTTLIVAVVLIVVAVVVHRQTSTFSRSAPGVSFSFSPGSLQREPVPAGQYALFAAHRGAQLTAELEVGPLTLPAYGGEMSGLEPLIAASDIRALAATVPGFALDGEGPTVLGGDDGYNFTYTRPLHDETYYGRVILLTARFAGVRRGVTISMLAQPVLAGIIGSGRAALAGALYEPGQGGVGVLFQPAGTLSGPLASFRLGR